LSLMKLATALLINKRYKLITELGRGGFAEVWLAEDLELDNRQVALKFFASERGLDSGGIELFKKEFTRTTELRHPNLLISNHYGVVENEHIPFLEMLYCSGGSLSSKIQSGAEFTEKEIASILKDVGSGLSYLHKQGVIHRDLKPDNILVSDTGQYLISDFGISLRLLSTLTKATQRHGGPSSGTTAFMAPELFRNDPNGSEKSDVFGLGVAIYELCTGILPWRGIGGLALLQGAESPTLQGHYSEQFEILVHRCLEVDPHKRPTAYELEMAAITFLKDGTWSTAKSDHRVTHQPERKNESVGRKTEIFIKENVGHEDRQEERIVLMKKNQNVKKWVAGILGSIFILVVTFYFIGVYIPFAKESSGTQLEPLDSATIPVDSTAVEVDLTADNTTENIVTNNANKVDDDKNQKIRRALAEGISAWGAMEYDKAFPLLKYTADQGNKESYYYLANMYLNGDGTPENLREALRLYRECANMGNARCQRTLGWFYQDGRILPKNLSEASKWYRKAAEQGDSESQYELALMYLGGRGVKQDSSEAAKWFIKRAEQGDADDLVNLGMRYYRGDGVRKNQFEAVKWFRKAAEQGSQQGQHNLGVAYDQGIGVTQNYNEAVKWYRKAGEQGRDDSQYLLGTMYENGKGVGKDVTQAVAWYKKAAVQGNKLAKEALSRLLPNESTLASYREVTGKVKNASDDDSPLPGVNVVLKGTTTGTVTDSEGNFKITVPPSGGTLIFSFIGLATVETAIGNDNIVNASLSASRRR
jgi:TPR repeat protein/serine/threonine protein kinase